MIFSFQVCITTARELQTNSECSVDLYLKSAIEGVVIKWVTQVNGETRNLFKLWMKCMDHCIFRRLHGNIRQCLQQRSKSCTKFRWVKVTNNSIFSFYLHFFKRTICIFIEFRNNARIKVRRSAEKIIFLQFSCAVAFKLCIFYYVVIVSDEWWLISLNNA